MARTFRSVQTLIGVILFLISGAAWAQSSSGSLRSFLDNSSGIFRLKQKQYFPAYQDFLRALNNDPLNPDLQMNLGLALEASEDYEKAEKAYMSALQLATNDKAREFQALFNLAGVRAKKEDIPGALEAYQAALEIEPESLEVKTNLELMWQSQQGKGSSNQNKKGGQGNDKDQNKDQNDKDKDQQNKDKQYEQPKKQPKPFQSKDLNKEDVRKILDEIENQEKGIRAKEYDKGAKEHRNEKDW